MSESSGGGVGGSSKHGKKPEQGPQSWESLVCYRNCNRPVCLEPRHWGGRVGGMAREAMRAGHIGFQVIRIWLECH